MTVGPVMPTPIYDELLRELALALESDNSEPPADPAPTSDA